MSRLQDPILTEPQPPNGIDLPPLHEPESIEMRTPYVAPSGVTVMTSKELAEPGSERIPSPPGFDRFGDRVSYITDRFVLGGSSDAYRVWRFQSAEPATEFPVTDEGWTRAWTTFRSLHSQPA